MMYGVVEPLTLKSMAFPIHGHAGCWNGPGYVKKPGKVAAMRGEGVKNPELIVIGAGPGGIAAAIEAAKAGPRCTSFHILKSSIISSP